MASLDTLEALISEEHTKLSNATMMPVSIGKLQTRLRAILLNPAPSQYGLVSYEAALRLRNTLREYLDTELEPSIAYHDRNVAKHKRTLTELSAELDLKKDASNKRNKEK